MNNHKGSNETYISETNPDAEPRCNASDGASGLYGSVTDGNIDGAIGDSVTGVSEYCFRDQYKYKCK